MAEMQSEPLEPEPDSTGVGMVTLIALPLCQTIFLALTRTDIYSYRLLRAAI